MNKFSNPASVWRCFHCDEIFVDRHCAAVHFGIDGLAMPVCVQAATEPMQALVASREEWRRRAHDAEFQNECLSDRLSTIESAIKGRWRGAISISDVSNRFESLEGEILALQEQIRGLTSPLASHQMSSLRRQILGEIIASLRARVDLSRWPLEVFALYDEAYRIEEQFASGVLADTTGTA